MSRDELPQVRCTPTDPSIEFDVFEMARVRLADALERRGYGRVEAERVALYVLEAARPVSKFLKTMTRVRPPEDEEIVDALGGVVDGAPALVKAKALLLAGVGQERGEREHPEGTTTQLTRSVTSPAEGRGEGGGTE